MTNKNSIVDSVVTVRFSGDSGDGMQLTGNQFSNNTAIFGNDLSTLPDFPAEIRAPAGSLAGVSAFQLKFSSKDIPWGRFFGQNKISTFLTPRPPNR